MFTEPRCQIIAEHTSLTILETIYQLALRGVENFFAGRSKDHRQSHRCYTIILRLDCTLAELLSI